MSVQAINQPSAVLSNGSRQTANNIAMRLNFAYLLRQNHSSLNKQSQTKNSGKKATEITSLNTHNYPSIPNSKLISLGSLSARKQTVAQLLLDNPQLKSKTWSIIHNPVNQGKNFNAIASGTTIFYNPATREIQWSSHNLFSRRTQLNPVTANDTSLLTARSDKPAKNSQPTIKLGQLNQDSPNIASLLAKLPEYKSQRWSIIHAPANNNKTFTRIPSGSTIYLNSETRELSWSSAKATEQTTTAGNLSHPKAKTLDDAVKSLMGTAYDKMDCYTLVVQGLKNMGVRYRGKGSLSSALLQRARTEGLAENTYFTGEGISEALGSKVYNKAITQVNNIEQQSRDIFQEMQQLMQKGDILSFSLETRGHTGIISQNQKQWTYINSGRLDHAIHNNAPRHGVGEEPLIKEISNWIKLAKKRRESLTITVGRLDRNKLV